MKKRILFVDDDVRLLAGLQRMLHGMRAEWEMEFVESGAQDLQPNGKTRSTESAGDGKRG